PLGRAIATIAAPSRDPEEPRFRGTMEHVSAETDAVVVPPYDAGRPYEEESDLPADRFLDLELSWLAFNERVLELAEDPDQPLLERVRHCAIFATNLDEFFMVRVAGLKRRLAAG